MTGLVSLKWWVGVINLKASPFNKLIITQSRWGKTAIKGAWPLSRKRETGRGFVKFLSLLNITWVRFKKHPHCSTADSGCWYKILEMKNFKTWLVFFLLEI